MLHPEYHAYRRDKLARALRHVSFVPDWRYAVEWAAEIRAQATGSRAYTEAWCRYLEAVNCPKGAIALRASRPSP